MKREEKINLVTVIAGAFASGTVTTAAMALLPPQVKLIGTITHALGSIVVGTAAGYACEKILKDKITEICDDFDNAKEVKFHKV